MLNEVVEAVGDVVELFAGGIAVSLEGKFHPVPGAGAVIGKEYRVSFPRQHLSRLGVAGNPFIGKIALRPAMHDHHQRILLLRLIIHGIDQQSLDFLPVAGKIADGLLFA